LARAVECARARATLGEISAAMEDVFGRYDTVPTPVSGIYGGAHGDSPQWRQAGEGVDAVERRLGRRPRMLVAKMGQDGHDRGANLVSSAFADLGFEIVPGPLFQTPEESARLAVAKDVDVVGASSLAAGHKTLVPELIGHLRILAGRTSRWWSAASSPPRIMRCSGKRACTPSSGRAPTWSRRRPRF
jgi:methylmalonyl-CoA mutase